MDQLEWNLIDPMRPTSWVAETNRGTWRVDFSDYRYQLYFQPRMTRGMLGQGAYSSLAQAQQRAAEADAGSPVDIPAHLR